MSASNKGANPNWHWQLVGYNGHRQTLLVQGKLREAQMLARERTRKRAKSLVNQVKPDVKRQKDGLIDLESLFE